MPSTDEAARRFSELPERARKTITQMRDEEWETFEVVVSLPARDVREGFELVRAARTISRFLKWLILGSVAIFFMGISLWEGILKVLGWVKGTP